MRKFIAVILIVGVLGMFGGCWRSEKSVRFVEEISVQWNENNSDIRQVFRHPDKLRLILNKVRTLGQRYSVDTDPEALETPTIIMTMLYSDGEQKTYFFKPDRYVRIGDAPWQQASPKQITALRLLLQSLPGDSRT